MGTPLMIQESDRDRIDALKKRMRAKSKVEVVRAGLELLEQELERRERVVRWKKAARLARESSQEVNREFRRFSRLKRLTP